MNQAKREVLGFEELIYRFERTVSVLGRSKTTFENYSRHVAAVAIYYGKIPTELDQEQIHDYLFYLQKSQKHLHRAILYSCDFIRILHFTYKDYKSGAVKKQMTLTHEEFIRRFALHILPKRFVKIRHCGILSSTWKRQKLKALQEKMQMRLPELKVIEQPERICSCCKVGKLITIQYFDRRGPPQTDIGMGQKSLKVSDNLQKS